MSTTDQHFCLKWNNHQDTLISLFSSLLDSNTFVDCTLAAGGKQLKVHKMILSACSPYFKEILLEHSDVHPIIILNNVQYSELVAIVEFMYRGEVNVSQDQLSVFLRAANALQVKGLTNESERLEEVVRETMSDYSGYQSSSDERIVKAEKDEDSHSLPGPSTSSDISGFMVNEQNSTINNVNVNDYSRSTSFIGLLPQSYDDNSLSAVQSPAGGGGSGLNKLIQLRRPNATEKDASFKCEVCNKFYRSKTSLNLHKRWECGKEPKFACPYCEKRTHQKDSGYKEWMSCSGLVENIVGRYSCLMCGKRYRWKSTLTRHEMFECGDKIPVHHCPYCDYSARQSGNLRVHIRRHHPGLGLTYSKTNAKT